MTKIKLELETDSDNELLSATINLKYKNGESEISNVKIKEEKPKGDGLLKRASSLSKSKKSTNVPVKETSIYDDLQKLPEAVEGIDDSFNTTF